MGMSTSPVVVDDLTWGWESETPSLTAEQSAMLDITIDEVRSSPLFSNVSIKAGRSAVWRYMEGAQWRLEPVGGKRVSEFVLETLRWRKQEGVDNVLDRAHSFSTEAASGKLFVRGACQLNRPLIWLHLGRENNVLDPEANVRFLIYTVVSEVGLCCASAVQAACYFSYKAYFDMFSMIPARYT